MSVSVEGAPSSRKGVQGSYTQRDCQHPSCSVYVSSCLEGSSTKARPSQFGSPQCPRPIVVPAAPQALMLEGSARMEIHMGTQVILTPSLPCGWGRAVAQVGVGVEKCLLTVVWLM